MKKTTNIFIAVILFVVCVGFVGCGNTVTDNNSFTVKYKYFTPYSPNKTNISVVGFTLEFENSDSEIRNVYTNEFTLEINGVLVEDGTFWRDETAVLGYLDIAPNRTETIMIRYGVTINFGEETTILFKHHDKTLVNSTTQFA